jgi:hypothetical protein
MLSSLPNRPLYQTETDTLSENEALDLAFPATPESIREDDDGNKRIHDLLLFMGETVATIAYQEAEEAWRLVTKETDENEDAYEVAYNKLLEYRGYDELDREEALKQAVSKLYGPSEGVIGGKS